MPITLPSASISTSVSVCWRSMFSTASARRFSLNGGAGISVRVISSRTKRSWSFSRKADAIVNSGLSMRRLTVADGLCADTRIQTENACGGDRRQNLHTNRAYFHAAAVSAANVSKSRGGWPRSFVQPGNCLGRCLQAVLLEVLEHVADVEHHPVGHVLE